MTHVDVLPARSACQMVIEQMQERSLVWWPGRAAESRRPLGTDGMGAMSHLTADVPAMIGALIGIDLISSTKTKQIHKAVITPAAALQVALQLQVDSHEDGQPVRQPEEASYLC